ncbi:MAG: hypothetical protein LBF54_02765 [Holosporaceae bacterium]|jgi:hypothetical protein|nr:hypothetical protein [Holosporaceae bacterium]
MLKKNIKFLLWCAVAVLVKNAECMGCYISLENMTDHPLLINFFKTDESIIKEDIALTGELIPASEAKTFHVSIISRAPMSDWDYVDVTQLNSEGQDVGNSVKLEWRSLGMSICFQLSTTSTSSLPFKVKRSSHEGPLIRYSFIKNDSNLKTKKENALVLVKQGIHNSKDLAVQSGLNCDVAAAVIKYAGF